MDDAKYFHNDDYSEDTIYGQINRRNKYLQTIGNLTLLNRTQNKEANNKSFEDKLETYSNDELETKLTEKITQHQSWDETKIKNRGQQFFEIAKQIWPPLPESTATN